MNDKFLLKWRLFMMFAITPLFGISVYMEYGSSRWVDFNHTRAAIATAVFVIGMLWIIKPWKGDNL